MSEKKNTQLTDPVYGAADANPSDAHRLRLSSTTTDGGSVLIHAHLGGIYIGMSERNWRQLFNTMKQLEVTVPAPTYRLLMDNEAGTAEFRLVTNREARA